MAAFNGGKLYHIFEAVKNPNASGKWGGSMIYTPEFTSAAAKEAFEDPNTTVLLKVDGECSCLIRETIEGPEGANKQWGFYCRRDNFSGKEQTYPLPDGLQPSTYDQGGKPHSYCLIRLDELATTGQGPAQKGRKKPVPSYPGPETYAAIAHGVAAGLIPNPNAPDCPPHLTVEWVGLKHQKNADGLTIEHGIVPHQAPFTPAINLLFLPRTFEAVQAFFQREVLEGVILIHPRTGERFKIRSEMFPDSAWDRLIEKKKPQDPAITTIRPMVLGNNGINII